MERRSRGSQHALSGYKAFELLSGEVFLPVTNYTGYTDGRSTGLTAFITETMKQDWRTNCETLLAVWAGADPYDFFDWRPWLAINPDHDLPWCERQFGEPVARRSATSKKKAPA